MASASLDMRSRRAIGEFTLQFCVGCVLVGAPCLLGLRPWADAARLLSMIFSLNAIMNFIRAARRGDRPGGASLNLWDAALAFNGCAALLHAITRYQA